MSPAAVAEDLRFVCRLVGWLGIHDAAAVAGQLRGHHRSLFVSLATQNTSSPRTYRELPESSGAHEDHLGVAATGRAHAYYGGWRYAAHGVPRSSGRSIIPTCHVRCRQSPACPVVLSAALRPGELRTDSLSSTSPTSPTASSGPRRVGHCWLSARQPPTDGTDRRTDCLSAESH